jgi:hypothetical protein
MSRFRLGHHTPLSQRGAAMMPRLARTDILRLVFCYALPAPFRIPAVLFRQS